MAIIEMAIGALLGIGFKELLSGDESSDEERSNDNGGEYSDYYPCVDD